MARKRINKNFVVSMAALAGLLGAGGYVAYKKATKPHNPQPFIAAGDQAMAAQDYAKAVTNYAQASELIPDNTTVHLKLGRAYFQSRDVRQENFLNAVAEFTKAEQLDPKSVDAWYGLLESSDVRVEGWENQPGDARDREQLPAAINLEREAAEHLTALQPQNVNARVAGSILVIRVWILGLPMPQSAAERDLPVDKQLTADQKAEQAITDLTRMKGEHPENDKVPYWIARAKIFQAQHLLVTDRAAEAVPLFAEAATEFDSCIAAKPEVVGLYLNKVKILDLLQRTDPLPTSAIEYQSHIREAMDQAQQHADPKKPAEYEMAKTWWAHTLEKTDPARAEGVYRDLITRMPNELAVRIDLASMLRRQATRRADAMAVLDGISSVSPPSATNVQARNTWNILVAEAKVVRADILTDGLPSTVPGPARDAMVKDIQDSLALAQPRLENTPDATRYYRVLGRFQLVNGQIVDAIQTLTRAADTMGTQGTNTDFDLLRDEANAYRQGQQTGKAIEILERAMNTDPSVSNNAEIHSELASLYLENQDYAKAKAYVDWLAIRYPTDPQVLILQIGVLGPNGDPQAVKQLFDQLPETTPDEIRSKSLVAIQIKRNDDAIRLMKLRNQSNPGDVGVAAQLAQMLYMANQVAEAREVLAKAEKLHPGDLSLKPTETYINGGSRDEVQVESLNTIMSVKDPFERQVRLADLYKAEERPEAEMTALQQAIKIRPNDVNVLQKLFVRHMDARRFSDAEALLPQLQALNADNAHGLMLKCRLQLAKQDVPGALLTGRQLTHDFGQFSNSWELYGEALRDSGQLDSACQQFVTARDLQVINVDATKNLIQCSVMQGKLDEAKGYIADAIKRFPEDPVYRAMQVQFEINYGEPEKILPAVAEVMKEHPENIQNYGVMIEALSAAIRRASDRGDADAASQYLARLTDTLRQGSKLAPDNLKIASGLADALFRSKDFAGAEKVLRNVADQPRWKNQPAPLIVLGRLYLKEQKPVQAEATLHEAISADNRSVDARLLLCDTLVIQQKYDDALAALQPALQDFTARSKYTELLLSMNRAAQAEVEVSQASAAEPSNNALKNLMIYVYYVEGKHDKAFAAANDAILADHSNVPAFYWLAKIESDGPKPDYDQAIKNLSYYQQSAPSDVQGRVLMAELLDYKHDRDGAIHQLELGLQFAPQDRSIRSTLLKDYLSSDPARLGDADTLITQTLAMPGYQHDPEFEAQAAMIWARRKEPDKAVAAIQDAMSRSSDKSALLADYFSVLLLTNNFDLIIDESSKYVSDPKTSWAVFNARAQAEAAKGDRDSAVTDFGTAMDRAGIEKSRGAAETVAFTIRDKLGGDKAIEMVVPRAQNSTAWKVIAIDLYIVNKDFSAGVKMIEPTLSQIDTLTPDVQYHVLQQASSLYLTIDPPMGQQAMKIYDRMLAMNPDDLEAMNDKACVLAEMLVPRQPEEALKWSTRAYDVSRNSGHINTRIYDTQGWVLILNHKLEDGIDILHQAIDAADFPDIHYHLGMAYLEKGLPEYAQKELTTASDMILAEQNIDARQKPDHALKTKVDAALKEVEVKLQANDPTKTAS